MATTAATTTKTWPPPPPPPPPPHHHHLTNMLGLHNIFLIAPPQAPSQAFNQNYNLSDTNHWTSKKNGLLNNDDKDDGEGDGGGCLKVCRDCGNRAKKECVHSRCRTCCKSRGYACATHVKSTWVPAAARRKDRKVVVTGEEHGRLDGGGSSGSSSYGGKKQRVLNFEAATSHQDSRLKESLPSQVRAPAVFRCIQVTAISDGETEVAYQATVNICGHVFKGFLYDHGVDVKNTFRSISKVVFESSGSGRDQDRDRDSSSPIIDPPNTFAASVEVGSV